jgi:hypothetical protein
MIEVDKAANRESKPDAEVISIAKPSGFSLEKFKSKRAAAVANVATLQMALPHYSIAQAKDFVRLHPDEEAYWSPELCFVNVPIKGMKRDTLHLIDEDIAMHYLPSARILRFRLALTCRRRMRVTAGTTATGLLVRRPRRSGYKQLPGRTKVSRRIRSITLRTPKPFRNRNGQSSHSAS